MNEYSEERSVFASEEKVTEDVVADGEAVEETADSAESEAVEDAPENVEQARYDTGF